MNYNKSDLTTRTQIISKSAQCKKGTFGFSLFRKLQKA